jgi:hypothetical protein
VSPHNWVLERQIPHELRPWRRWTETAPTDPSGKVVADWNAGGERFFENSHYLVFVRPMVPSDSDTPPAFHLSMRTIENDTRHDWREIQRVKNELLGEDWEGIELYPAESRVVDTANQYHLWCFPFVLPFGFAYGERGTADEASAIGAVQRDFS